MPQLSSRAVRTRSEVRPTPSLYPGGRGTPLNCMLSTCVRAALSAGRHQTKDRRSGRVVLEHPFVSARTPFEGGANLRCRRQCSVSSASFAACAVCFSLRAAFLVCHDFWSVFGFGFSFVCFGRAFGAAMFFSLSSICQLTGRSSRRSTTGVKDRGEGSASLSRRRRKSRGGSPRLQIRNRLDGRIRKVSQSWSTCAVGSRGARTIAQRLPSSLAT